MYVGEMNEAMPMAMPVKISAVISQGMEVTKLFPENPLRRLCRGDDEAAPSQPVCQRAAQRSTHDGTHKHGADDELLHR
jgi:hypothetical protein